MKIELRVGAAFVSCETDYIPEGGDSMQDALFDRLLKITVEQADKIGAKLYGCGPDAMDADEEWPRQRAKTKGWLEMANDKETLEEISTWIRVDFHEICPWQAHGGRCAGCPLGSAGNNCIFDKIADKVDAAAKRDAAIHAMTVEANERLREHLEIAIENDKRTAVGNAPALCEALKAIVAICDGADTGGLDERTAIYNIARAALAEHGGWRKESEVSK